jgi:hypothetical protein
MTAHCRPISHREFDLRSSVEIAQVILDGRSRGDSVMGILESIDEQFPDLSFRSFLGGHALADCIAAGTVRVLAPALN